MRLRPRAPLPPLLLLLAALAAAVPARASIEQFSTFDVLAPEVDDENAIDYLLMRPTDNWRDEWDTSPAALRTDQGCMTSAIWYQANEFKARSPMGGRAWLDFGFVQHTDPEGSYQWLQFDFLHAVGNAGAAGFRFRPSYDKSQQDFAALWTSGDGRSPLQARFTFSVEDMFDELWTFHQIAVGDQHYEIYRVHPFEPSFELVWRGERHRIEIADAWLMPMRQDIVDPSPAVSGTRSLRGDRGRVLAERALGSWTLLSRFESTSARSTRSNLVDPGDGRNDRRQWSAEGGLRRVLGPRLTAEARYVYQVRAEDWRPPVASASFHALDRIGQGELAWQVRGEWRLRFGLLYDRIGIARTGEVPGFTYGSRKESRGYIGIQARLGRVRLQAMEGIELDSEPYKVTFHHDKGFLHLQTTF